MHRSSSLIDESSRLKQFAWEQWDDQVIAVIFRPGHYGLDRYVVKRYVEQVLSQSERWKQLSSCFSNISPLVHAYSLTSYEVELMRRILDYHLSDKLHLRITQTHDQLIEYESLLDFISRSQELYSSNPHSYTNIHPSNGKKTSIPSIPSSHSPYILPLSAKSMIPPVSQPNKTQGSTANTNGHHTSQSSNNSSISQIKSNLTSNQSNVHIPPELCPMTLHNVKIDGSGWVQINNVYLPFIIKARQRLVPYQVLVSCKILEPDELRSILTPATSADLTLINSMIRDCKIDNEQIPENALLINIYHVLIGTKNIIYAKILPNDNPTSKINRQYKSVLVLQGGSLSITTRLVPFVCSGTHSYIPLSEVVTIYPNLYTQLQTLARVPRTNELDYLQLVQLYSNEKELPLDALLIDVEDLNQTQIIPSKKISLIDYHAKEKSKLEQQISLLKKPVTNKRKNQDSHDNRPVQQRFKPSTSSNQFRQTRPVFIRPPTGYYPAPSVLPYHQQQSHWLSANNGHRGRTRWQ